MVDPGNRRLWSRHALRAPGLPVLVAMGLTLGITGPQGAVLAESPADNDVLGLPIRWCVLQGTRAAADANASVLKLNRDASSILLPEAGLALQSPLTAALGAAPSFPVIRDPRPNLGKRGDVRIPTESSSEYRRIISRCRLAWQALAPRGGSDGSEGATARGPIGVIIRRFVGGAGRPVPSFRGYARAMTTNADLCSADPPDVGWSMGGELMVEERARRPSDPVTTPRVTAHEVGHLLGLGHGDGSDDVGSTPGRIDGWCDPGEDALATPASLMTPDSSGERLTPRQRRLMRSVLAAHPSVVRDAIPLLPEPNTTASLTRLPGLGDLGVRGAEAYDTVHESAAGVSRRRGAEDLVGFGLWVAEDPGTPVLTLQNRGTPGGDGTAEYVALLDTDGDPDTGGISGGIVEVPDRLVNNGSGTDLVIWVVVGTGAPASRVWRWAEGDRRWVELTPPVTELTGPFGEEDRATPYPSDGPTRDTVAVTLDALDAIDIADHPRIRIESRTSRRGGPNVIDALPGDPGSGDMMELRLDSPQYPVCALNRSGVTPNHSLPGDTAVLEVHGFGIDGPVTAWLGDEARPVARGVYEEVPGCAWPWITQVRMPDDVLEPVAMLQVAKGGTGLAAVCPVVIGMATGSGDGASR